VIEFNKNAKRIILSHSRIHEDEAKAEAVPLKQIAGAEKESRSSANGSRFERKVEKTTLGDINDLAALKEERTPKLWPALAAKAKKAKKAGSRCSKAAKADEAEKS
jgi:small subunit ribosomal protein S1